MHGNGTLKRADQTSLANPDNPPSLAFVKENIDVLRTMIKEHGHQAKAKATPKKLVYGDSKREAPDEGRRGWRTEAEPKKGPEGRGPNPEGGVPNLPPFTRRITRFKYHRRAKLLRNIKVYEGNKDLEDHLSIFSAAAEQEEWPMPTWCKMFHQTLGGAARNWFDDSDSKSVDSFKELSQKFLEEFSQQKRYAKDPTKIHGIKRRPSEGLQTFMDQFKSESSHIKGVPSVLRISAFMHGHGHPELAKKLNEKKYPRRWTKCSKGSEPSFEERQPQVWQNWSVLLNGIKEALARYGPEDKRRLETEVVQGSYKETWGCIPLTREETPSPHSLKLQRKFWPWKA
ncbi:reverse transcriptase domain-containing protein [Tanacetum coccineum]